MSATGRQRVFISGCSTGIGRALAMEFATRGHDVIATARKVETLSDLAGKGMLTLPLDVTSTESIDAAIDSSVKSKGGIDILVNNAGFGLMGPIAEISLNDLRRQYETNIIGPVALAQAVFPLMCKQQRGCIVNVSSVSGVLTSPFSGAYCSSKSAFNSISDAMRMEMAPFGVSVVTVQPGAIRSKFGDTAASSLAGIFRDDSPYKPLIGYMEKRAQSGQMGAMEAEEFAKIVVSGCTSQNPPIFIRAGKNSSLMPFMRRFVPQSVIDNMMVKRFGLDTINK